MRQYCSYCNEPDRDQLFLNFFKWFTGFRVNHTYIGQALGVVLSRVPLYFDSSFELFPTLAQLI